MPKGNAPLPLLLASHQLEQLLGSQYHALLHSIHQLENTAKTLALREDPHSAALAGLYNLYNDYPPNDLNLQKIFAEIFANCLPLYRLARADQPLATLKLAEQNIEQAMDALKQTDWSRRYTALEYLDIIAGQYRAALSDFSASVDYPQCLQDYQQQAGCAILGAGYYQLDIETARKILCINQYGDEVKTNEAGARAVAAANGVHYKPNPNSTPENLKAPINPGKEYAVSTLMQLIAGNQLAAAPSTLLSIQHLPLANRETQGLIQASLTISGMCFKDFLQCREAITAWQQRLIANDVVKLLQDSQHGFQIAKTIAQQHYPQVFNANTPEQQSETLRIAFEQITGQTPPKQQLRDIKGNQSRPEHNRCNMFRDVFEGYLQAGGQLEHFYILLGIVQRYPGIMCDNTITDLLMQLKHTQRLLTLFPAAPLEQAITDIHAILTPKYLDSEAVSALWIGLLLSLPCDAKFDNFMLELHYDDKQTLKSCRIVGIDNDLSLKMPFSVNEEKQLCLEMKNMLIALPELMNQPLHPSIRQRFLSTSAESQWLLWLSILARRDNDYSLWEKQGTATRQALNTIDLPVKFSPQVLHFVKTQWQALQQLLQQQADITHRQCLQHLYPAVAAAYRGLAEMMPDSPLQQEAGLYQFFEMGGSCPLEKLLGNAISPGIVTNATTQSEQQDTNKDYITAKKIVDDALKTTNWHEIPKDAQWPLVEAFALLPHLSSKDWQGSTPGDMSTLIQSWFQEAVRRANPFIAECLLNCGAKVDHCDESQQTVLHYLCRHYLYYPNSHTVFLMANVLLSHHSCQPNASNTHGYTPLLQWMNATPEPMHLKPDEINSAEVLLEALIAHGANLEAKDSVTHETVLDKTAKENQEKPYWFIKLIEKGAGIHANGELIALFLQKKQSEMQQNPAWQQSIAMLEQRNLMLRWRLSQSTWEKKSSKAADMMVIGLNANKVYLPKPIQQTLITAEQQFNSKGENKETYGRRVVQAIQYRHAEWHVKEHPEMPGIEKAVNLFAALLFGQHTAPHELFAFFDAQQNPYPVLISQTIPGENLHDILKQHTPQRNTHSSSSRSDEQPLHHMLQQLHPQYLSEQLITAMLIHPEDGKPDNYQVMAIDPNNPKSLYRIIGVDNDHAFVRPVNNDILQVKCVLFCLDLMRQPVHPSVRARLLSISPEDFLRDWLKALQAYQTRANQLFDYAARKRWFEGVNALKVWFGFERERLPVIITIPFRRHAITEILDRFTQLQHQLRKYPTISHLRLLTKLTPTLGIRYAEAFRLYPATHEVAKRFQDIAQRHYRNAVDGHYKTLTTSLIAAEQMGLSKQELANLHTDEGSQALSPEAALIELRQAIQERKNNKQFMAQLAQGDFSGLRRLLSQHMKECLINQLDFAEITLAGSKEPDLQKQQSLLIAIIQENIAFQRLSIKNCRALTDAHMAQLLSLSPHLTRLTLSNCPNITYATIETIDQYNLALESLTLHQLSLLIAIGVKRPFNALYGSMDLPHLRKLNLSDNLQLQQVALKCPQLTHASLDHNPQLTRIVLDSDILQALNISHCKQFNDAALAATIRNYPLIPPLNLQGCQDIQSRVFHHVSAHIPHLFQMFSLERWLHREEFFNRCLSEAVFDFSQETFDMMEMTVIASLLSKNPRLLEVDFANTPISDEAVFMLLDAFCTHPTLKVLKITLDDLSVVHPIIVAILKYNSILTTFIINEVDCIQLRNILHQQNANLALGNTSENKMFVIAALLKTNSVLKILNLSSSRLSEKNMALLCSSLQENTCLEILDLRHSDVNDDAVILLLATLQKNSTLQLINLDGNPCSENIKHDIITLCFKRCKKSNNTAWLQHYLNALQLDDSNTVDFTSKEPFVLLEWQKITGTFYGSFNLQMIKWLKFDLSNDGEIDVPSTARDSFNEKLAPSLRAESRSFQSNPSCLATLNGHSGFVNTLTQLHDGRLVSGSIDNSIKLWDVYNLSCLATLNGHSSSVLSLTQLHDGRFASGSSDTSIKLWDIHKPSCLATLNGHSGSVFTLTQLHDGRLVSGSSDNSIKLWDTNNLSYLATLNGHSSYVYTLTQLHDGRLVSGSADGSIKLWDINNLSCLATLNGHSFPVLTLTQLHDGRLASGSEDNSIKLWDIHNFSCLATLKGHSGFVYTLTQLQDGRLVSGSSDNSIKLWDSYNLSCLATLNGHSSYVNTLTQLHDGRIVSGSFDFSIKLWDVALNFICSVDVSFRAKLPALFSLRKNLSSIFIGLLPQSLAPDNTLLSLQSLHTFVQGLLFNCYARNNSFFSVKITLDEKQHSLSIVCPNETLALQLYDCLKTFFYPSSLKPFLKLCSLTNPQQQSKSAGKMPENSAMNRRQSSPHNRYSFHAPIQNAPSTSSQQVPGSSSLTYN